MEVDDDGNPIFPADDNGGGSGGSEVEQKRTPEAAGDGKDKRKRKTPAQLEILENAYAVNHFPPLEKRRELSVKLGLSTEQLRVWFCRRRLKDRKTVTMVSSSNADEGPFINAISAVEEKLGEPLREDGPVLGFAFDPLPPGAFATPIERAERRKPVRASYMTGLHDTPDHGPIKGAKGTSLRIGGEPSAANGRHVVPHYNSLPVQSPRTRTALSVGSFYAYGNQRPTSGVLRLRGSQPHVVTPTSSRLNLGVDSKDVEVARQVEAREKRTRKDHLEELDMLRQKKGEEMMKDMVMQEHGKQKQDGSLLCEERYQRELRELRHEVERREMILLKESIRVEEEKRYIRKLKHKVERRENFLLKESIRAEKLRAKEDLNQKKQVERPTTASEVLDLIEAAKRTELMNLASSNMGLPSVSATDNETLQRLQSYGGGQSANG